VKSLPVESVWTVVDGDDAGQWILPGMHTVNRICYLITELPHGWKDIRLKPNHLSYRTMQSKPIALHGLLPARGYSLTGSDLKRQVNQIVREGMQNSDYPLPGESITGGSKSLTVSQLFCR